MIEFKKSSILDTHLSNGALQGSHTYQQNGLELLQGYNTINNTEMFLKKGWYDKNLQLIDFLTEDEQKEINQVLPF